MIGLPSAPEHAAARRALRLWAFALCAITLCAYLPILRADFVDFDDFVHVVEEPHVMRGLTADGVAYVLTHRMISNYHPITTLSQMLDVELFGMNPHAHHAINVLLHLINGVLLLFGMHALTGRRGPSIAVAAVFLLHPLNVESVAWLSQRKTLLFTLFGLLAFGAYARYVRSGDRRAYYASLAWFTASLLSKAMLITMPALLLILDVWPLGRLGPAPFSTRPDAKTLRAMALDKLPFAALAIGCALIAYNAQEAGGSLTTLDTFGPSGRVLTVTLGYAGYVQKLFWPFDLSMLRGNPFMQLSGAEPVGVAHIVAAVLLLSALTAFALFEARRRPYLLAGLAFYVCSAVPIIGFVQLTDHLMADRYSYVTLLGIVLALAMLVEEALHAIGPRARRIVLLTAGLPLVLGLALRTADQQQHWQNSVAVFTRAQHYTPTSSSLLMQLGRAYKRAGDIERSLIYYARSLRYPPTQEEALRHVAVLGAGLSQQATDPRGIAALQAYHGIVSREVPTIEARRKLAIALRARGALGEAAYWEGAQASGEGPAATRADRELQP